MAGTGGFVFNHIAQEAPLNNPTFTGTVTTQDLVVTDNGAASNAPVSVTGIPFAGTGTTSFPQVYINSSDATASTTLNTSGTQFGVNSHGVRDLANLMVDGATKVKISNNGTLTTQGFVTFPAANTGITAATGNAGEVYFSSTSITIDRNINDANATLLVNNIHASSTGDVVDFQSGGATKVLVSKAGDLKIATAGNGLYVKEGSNACMGTAVLNGTTEVTVSTTKVTASSRIFITINTPGGTVASAYVSSRVAGTSFGIKSTGAADTSTVAWMIVEPA